MKLITLLCISLISFTAQALNYTGLYSYNKGVNKASGSMYFIQFKPDSAFFMLQSISGMPDFLSTELKGFVSINNTTATYLGKDAAEIQFQFSANACTLMQNENCKFEFSTNGKYKKTSAVIKKGSSFLPGLDERTGMVAKDSTICLDIPHAEGTKKFTLMKSELITVTDECNGYYLIEIPKKKNEFLWVFKKNIQLKKNK